MEVQEMEEATAIGTTYPRLIVDSTGKITDTIDPEPSVPRTVESLNPTQNLNDLLTLKNLTGTNLDVANKLSLLPSSAGSEIVLCEEQALQIVNSETENVSSTNEDQQLVMATLVKGVDGQLYQVRFVHDSLSESGHQLLQGDSALILGGETSLAETTGSSDGIDLSNQETLLVIESDDFQEFGASDSRKESDTTEKGNERASTALGELLLSKTTNLDSSMVTSTPPPAKKSRVETTASNSNVKANTSIFVKNRQREPKTIGPVKTPKSPKPTLQPKRRPLRSVSDDIDPDSVLKIQGKMGERIRDNFCKMKSSGGPAFVTCRQCIQQVKRARVFTDSRKSLSGLLNHIALHEEIKDGGDVTELDLGEEEDEIDEADGQAQTQEYGRAHSQEDGQAQSQEYGQAQSQEYGQAETQQLDQDQSQQTETRTQQPSEQDSLNTPQFEQDSSTPEPSTTMASKEISNPVENKTIEDSITKPVKQQVKVEIKVKDVKNSNNSKEDASDPSIELYACVVCNLSFSNFDEFVSHSTDHSKAKHSCDSTKQDNKPVMIRNENANLSLISADDEDEESKLELQVDDSNNDLMDEMQFKIPSEQSRLLIESIADHVAPALGNGEESKPKNAEKGKISDSKKSKRRVSKVSNRCVSAESSGHDSDKPFVCFECGDGEPTCQLLRQHMTRMHGDRARVFVCKTCRVTWSEKNFPDFQHHLIQNHPNDEISCYFCQLKFATCEDIKYHHAQHRPPLNYCCPYCYHEFSWLLEEEFTAHILQHQNEDLPFKCRDCNLCFTDFVARRTHQNDLGHDLDARKFHDELRPFICTGCGKQFVNTGRTTGICSLKRHICQSGVTLDPNVECPYCKRIFPLERKLREHMRQKHEHHVCHICSIVCKSKASLDEHVGSEHFGGQFVCPVCLENFDTSQKMKQHRTREHGARNFICEFCGQGFAGRLLLVRHLKKHDEFQSYVCNVCGDKFLLADRLETHFRKYHAHVVSAQEYETIVIDNVQTAALAAETIAIIQE